MPRSSEQRLRAGTLVSVLVAGLIAGVLMSIWSARGLGSGTAPDIAHLLRMTALQAAVSTLASLGAGIGLAWALDRLRFWGRDALVALLSAAIVTPAIVMAVGIIAIWGRAGWINLALAKIGLEAGSIFGLHGIVYAHAALNAPFAAAILFARLQAQSGTRLRLARNLRLSSGQRFRILDLPTLLPALPGLGAVIFLLCFTSFPVVLILGGGPANQSFETAIYTAVRLNFDLGAAAELAAVQLLVTAIVIVPATLFAALPPTAGVHTALHWPEPRPVASAAALLLVGLGLAFGLPLLSILADGTVISPLLAQPRFWRALANSLSIGAASALAALILGLVIALARISARNRIEKGVLGFPAYAYLALPGVTLALGLFLMVRRTGVPPENAAPFVLVLANALLALPFALSTLIPALSAANARYDRLARSLALSNTKRFASVEFPLIGREIGLVLAIGFGFSLGDLSAISLFGTQDFSTLPWLMHRALGSYRTNDAAAIAAILLILSIAVFLVLPRLTQRLSHAAAR